MESGSGAVRPPRAGVDRPVVVVRTRAGLEVTLRSLLASDRELVRAFISTLSQRSLSLRFMSSRRPSEEELLERLTRVDSARDLAVVALVELEAGPRLAGLCRALSTGPGRAEFAVLVSDPFQGRGVGAALLARLVALSRSGGCERLWGLVSSENAAMLALARGRGYGVRWSSELAVYEVTIAL